MNFGDLEQQYGLPLGLLSAVQSVESGGDPNAVSPKGAVGPFQFMPATAKQYGIDPTDPAQAAVGAARMLADLGKKYGGDVTKMLAAYNWGQGNVDRQGLAKAPPETQQYIQKVNAKMPDLDSLIDSLPAAPAGQNLDAMIDALPNVAQNQPAPGVAQSALIGIGAGLDRAAAGLRQATPAPVRNAVDWLNSKLGMGQVPSIDPAVQQANAAALKPLEQANPVTMMLSENAPAMAAKTPLGMAAMAALNFGTPLERATSAGLAYAGGKAGEGVARMFGPKSMAPIADNGASEFFDYPASQGNAWGIPLRAAQTTDSMPIKILDAVASNMPFSSGVIGKAKDATYGAFNRAVANTFGEDSTQLTPELLGNALERSGKQIGGIMQRATAQLSPEQAQQVAHLSGVIADLGPEGQVLNNKLGRVIDGMTNGQALTGQTLRMLDSSLGRIMGTTQNGDLRYAAANLQNIVRDAATNSLSDADAQALRLARQQNFNVRQVADATKSGALTPAQLLTQVNSYQRNARYGGGNDLADLAQWAKKTIPDAIPNSGTAQREWYQKLLTNPITTIGTVGGAAYGADKMGISPQSAAEGLLLPYLAARGMAGKPASEFTKNLLARSGALAGLLGYQASH